MYFLHLLHCRFFSRPNFPNQNLRYPPLLTCPPPLNPTYNQVFPRAHVFSENRRASDQYFNVSVPSPLPGPRLRVEGSAINMTMTAGTFSVYIRFAQMWHRHAYAHTHTSTSTYTNTHIQTHTCTHAHTLEDTLTHMYIHTCMHIHVYVRLSCEDIQIDVSVLTRTHLNVLSIDRRLSLSRSFALTRMVSLAFFLSLGLSLSHKHTHIHKHMLSLSVSVALALSVSSSRSLSLTHSHTHTHARMNTRTITHTLTPSSPPWYIWQATLWVCTHSFLLQRVRLIASLTVWSHVFLLTRATN